jgi:hypothetical protein
VDGHDDGPHAREPQLEDLARIGAALNAAGARYVLIGGFAVIAQGATRTTKDIDLLVDPGADNIARLRTALSVLEDGAINEVEDDDVSRYTVVRVADEFVIDLMALACGIDYLEARKDAETLRVLDVPILVASPATLIRTKDTFRPSDHADCTYLRALIEARARQP